MPLLTINPVLPTEVDLLLEFIQELADYEKLSSSVVATPEQLRRSLFGRNRFVQAIIARIDSEPVGFALYFCNYSTFLAKPGLYLEDLYVRPAHRGQGLGKALLKFIARDAVRIGAGRLEWSVLDWNEAAIGFYKTLGAIPMDEWTVFRLSGEALASFGSLDGTSPLVPTLSAERFSLRQGSVNDAQRICDLMQDPSISQNLASAPWPYTVEDAKSYLSGIGTSADELDWVMDHPEFGVMGSIHMSITRRHFRGYLGFWLGKEFRGQGFMAEAILRVSEFGFTEIGLERIEAEHFAQNMASGRAMEKAGMVKEGVRYAAMRKGDQQLDLVVYGRARRVQG
jgi:RimJ/RimL family protein N-acetyltransferase